MILQIIGFVLMLLCYTVSAAQNSLLMYVKTIKSDQEIETINDSLPLFIIENRVYQIRSECIVRRNDFGYRSRLDGQGNNERLSDGGVNNRLNDDRDKSRLEGGGGSERMSGGGAGGRNSSGGLDVLGCGMDEWGRLIIYVENPKAVKQARLYYDKRLYNYSDNFFKIKKF